MNLSKYCAEPGKSPEQQTTSDQNHLDELPRKKKPHKIGRRTLYIFLIIFVILMLVCLFLVLPMINKKAQYSALICVPENATIDQVHDSVAKYLGDDYADATRTAYRLLSGQGDNKTRYGAWRIEEGMTPFQAARLMTRGGQTGISVTLNNQRTKEDIAHLFASKLHFSEEEFLNMLNDEQLLRKYDIYPDQVLVYFLKDKYDFYWTATPEDVLKAMRDNYKKFWTTERHDKADKLGLSRSDMVILASIVDAETENSNEKGTIGRLYLNRLDKDMPLQSDPTVIYAVGDFTITRVGGDMLNTDSPYNTYKYKGLPPGPIRLTSSATIDAILTSRPHNYLFMCANEELNGTHNFAVTYEEHLENSKRYQKELDRRGITLKNDSTTKKE